MNLLQGPWIPVRDAKGKRDWITPDRLSEPQWRAFDANRPDFNGALAQFAIGLLQTTTPVSNSIEWRTWFRNPPDAATLHNWFEPVQDAFVLDGDGPRFMQDADLDLGNSDVKFSDIGALMIESPGENTQKNNVDHFVKRGRINVLCPACAALALFTLQVNAPSGGAGHRTGLRGGGPLTTLVVGPPGSTLWHDIWLNVRDRTTFLCDPGDTATSERQRIFPWLGSISALQAEKGELAQAQVHPAHVYWAMPRRIRLETGTGRSGQCDSCARSVPELVARFCTKNYGLNYKGAWMHPLSPYYETKEGWLPIHPQPDGLGYRHWLAWVLGASSERKSTRIAAVVERAISQLHRQTGGALRLWAFGYDMDNMKARCWHESTMPLYGLTDCDANGRAAAQDEVARWLSAAELTASYLREAVKEGWFSQDPRGEFSHVDAEFWGRTEALFFAQLKTLIDATRDSAKVPTLALREAWHAEIVAAALHLFEAAFVGAGAVERQNPRRIALANNQLRARLYGPKLKQAIGLAPPESADSSGRKERHAIKTAAIKESA